MIGSAQLLEEAIAEVAPTGPFSIALATKDGIASRCGGHWPSGTPMLDSHLFYGASLAKQVTGAAIALLVVDGRLELEKSVSTYLPHAGEWADHVSTRHLLHHVGGLPVQGALESRLEGDWTRDGILETLFSLPAPQAGQSFSYSNVGYVVLAEIVKAIAGMPCPSFSVSGSVSHFILTKFGSPTRRDILRASNGPCWDRICL